MTDRFKRQRDSEHNGKPCRDVMERFSWEVRMFNQWLRMARSPRPQKRGAVR